MEKPHMRIYKDLINKLSNPKTNDLNNNFLEDFYINRLIVFNKETKN